MGPALDAAAAGYSVETSRGDAAARIVRGDDDEPRARRVPGRARPARRHEAHRRTTVIKDGVQDLAKLRSSRRVPRAEPGAGGDESDGDEDTQTADAIRANRRTQTAIFGFDGLDETVAEVKKRGAEAAQSKRAGKLDQEEEEAEDEDEDDGPLPFPVIHPTHDNKIYWDLWISLCIVWSTMTVPYGIGFGVAPSSKCLPGVYAIDSVVDVSFIVDMSLVFFTAYREPLTGKLEGSLSKIRTRYFKGSFIIDFLSTFPFDLVTNPMAPVGPCGGGGGLRIFKVLRIVRLAKLTKLVKLLRLKNQKGSKDADAAMKSSGTSPSSALLQLLLQMFYVAHWVACIRHFQTLAPEPHAALGLGEDSDYTGNGHLSKDDGLMARQNDQPVPVWNWRTTMEADRGAKFERKGHAYLLSLYWAFTTMTTVGYGDIPVVGANEQAFAIFVMIIGGAFFGYIMGTITSLLENFDQATVLYREKVNLVKDYVYDRSYPESLSKRIVGHVKHCYTCHTCFDQERIFETMPAGVRLDVIQVKYAKLISNVPFLRGSPKAFAAMLVPDMLPLLLPQSEVLFFDGEVATHLFCVDDGKISCFAQTISTDHPVVARPVREYAEGDLIGTASILLTTTQSTTCIAAEPSNLHMMTKELLVDALNAYPDVHKRLHRAALRQQRVIELATKWTPPADAPSSSERPTFSRRQTSRMSVISIEPPDDHEGPTPEHSDDEDDDMGVKKKKKSSLALLKAASKFKIGGAARSFRKAAAGADSPGSGGESPANSPTPSAASPPARPPLKSAGSMMFAAAAKASAAENESDPKNQSDPKSPGGSDSERASGGSMRGVDLFRKAASSLGKMSLLTKTWSRGSFLMSKRSQDDDAGGPPAAPVNMTPSELWERKRIIHPEAPLKVAWDLFVAALIILSVLIVTYRLGFRVPNPGYNDLPQYAILDDVVDALFGIDLICSFCTAYFKDMKLVHNRRDIATTYAKGWLVIDFTSTLPLRHVASGIPALGSLKLLKALRLIRLAKIARVLKMQNIMNTLEDTCGVNPAVFRVVTPLLVVFFAAHLFACGFHYIGASFSRVKCDVSSSRDWATYPLSPEETAGSWLDQVCIYKDYCAYRGETVTKTFVDGGLGGECDHRDIHRGYFTKQKLNKVCWTRAREYCWPDPYPPDPDFVSYAPSVSPWLNTSTPTTSPTDAPPTANPTETFAPTAFDACNPCGRQKSVKDANLFTQYNMALYWAFATMTTVGYGDVGPSKEHRAGMVYCIFAQVIGTMIFAFSGRAGNDVRKIRVAAATSYPREIHVAAAAATRLHGISASPAAASPRPSSPRNIRAIAAATRLRGISTS